ncbi:hypothetical protein [Natronorubrum texcoconense]|uniref:Uncharacterized protein n=1 Tax=Natronorubrum texcoconense TaxID=1095776 RepID=A0A1G8TG18_9EURY|nr:hypothetical protein [Natronorubrum texcoconense]SDJ40458.1 hypothetical protein SAMN04515672_0455 [Natronorubrum texcoconense]
MTQDHPLKILLKDFLPLGIVSDIKSRINQTDWDGFFETLFAVGFVLTVFSTIGFILLYSVLSFALDGSGILSMIFSLLLNLTFFAVIIYVPGILLLRGVNSASESQLQVIDLPPNAEKHAARIRGATGFAIIRYMVNLLLLSVMIGYVAFIRNNLVITDIPNLDLYSPQFYFSVLIVLLADFIYIGLLLITISQWYATVKSQPV